MRKKEILFSKLQTKDTAEYRQAYALQVIAEVLIDIRDLLDINRGGGGGGSRSPINMDYGGRGGAGK